jgi:hypothetical protein
MVEADIPSTEPSINSDAGMPRRGEYKIVRTDGTEAVLEGKPSYEEICRLISCDTLDTVRIGPRRGLTMFCDDTGMIDGKPVNPKAKALYLAVCRPGALHSIHGDVVIVPAGGLG